MVEIIHKKEKDPIITQIVFTATESQKKAIDKIKLQKRDWDVNAMFRQFAEKLIAESGIDLNSVG